jgi:hypothetical protein
MSGNNTISEIKNLPKEIGTLVIFNNAENFKLRELPEKLNMIYLNDNYSNMFFETIIKKRRSKIKNIYFRNNLFQKRSKQKSDKNKFTNNSIYGNVIYHNCSFIFFILGVFWIYE